MQLAKNLYLSRDKQLSRKVQEALLTMLLEQELGKDQLLELYFNVIEFGPDVWGIGMASDHYFNAKPHELSLAQAFFLASILPSPRANHFREDGSVDPEWRLHLNRLLRIAHERGRISAVELESALAEPLEFGVPQLLPDEDGAGDAEGRTASEPGEPNWAREMEPPDPERR